MADGRASRRLERLLLLLPLAYRDEGVSLEEVARLTGTTTERVKEDVQELTERVFYHPPGSGSDIQLGWEGDRLTIFTTREFRRPRRLGPREAIALALGLRVVAVEDPSPGEDARGLAERLERELAWRPDRRPPPFLEVDPGAPRDDPTRARLMEAARETRRCRIHYFKSGSEEPKEREIDPYLVAHAEAQWYVVGYCHRSDGIRVFRVDRVLDAEPLAPTFQLPDDFDPDAYLRGVRVLDTDPREAGTVEIRYSATIARWIRERGWSDTEEDPDGSVRVRHPAADPEWAVRHVLQYGGEAELLAPPELRRAVARRLAAILGEEPGGGGDAAS